MRETGRAREEVYVPLAHTEGGLSASLYRGARAAAESGGFRTYVLARPDHQRVLLRLQVGGRRRRARATGSRARSSDARWLDGDRRPVRLAARAAARGRRRTSSARCATCSGAGRPATPCGPNMMTRNSLRAEHGLRARARAGDDRARDPRGEHGRRQEAVVRVLPARGHGKTVLAEATLTDDAVRRVLRTTIDDLLELSWAGTHGAVASGMQSVAFTPGVRDRGAVRRDRAGPRDGRHELDGARHRPARRGRAQRARSGSPGSRSGRSAAARRSPTRARGSR